MIAARYPFVSIDEEHDWRVVQVCEVRGCPHRHACRYCRWRAGWRVTRPRSTVPPQGSLGFDETGVVQKLAVPLARAGITVAYLST